MIFSQKAPSAQSLAYNSPVHVSTSTRKPQNFNVPTQILKDCQPNCMRQFPTPLQDERQTVH